MANWCENLLMVTGLPDAVAAFVAKARGKEHRFHEAGPTEPEEDLCFHALYPVPPEILNGPYEPTGYRWELTHWGVKQGHSGSTLTWLGPGKVEYLFATPWASPDLLFDQVAVDFPGLRFELKWHEPGIGRVGAVVWEGGQRAGSWDREQTDEEFAALEWAWEREESTAPVLRRLAP